MQNIIRVNLGDIEELNIKDKGGVGRNTAWHSLGTIPHVWGDRQLGSLALGHLGNTIIPPSNNLSFSNIELEWLAPVPGAVNLLAICQGQHVVACHLLPSSWEGGPISWLEGLALNTHDV